MRLFIVASAVVALLTASVPARADDSLESSMKELAKTIQDLLAKEGQTAVAVGEFSPSTRVRLADKNAAITTSTGPRIQFELIRQLQLINVTNNPAANIEIKGDFEAATNARTGLLEVVIEVRFRGASGDNLGGLRTRYAVNNTSDVALITGSTTPLDPRSDKETDNKEIQRRIANPDVVIDGTRVRSTQGQPYSIEIRVKSSIESPAVPRAPTIRDGHAFIKLQPSELYEVHVYNESPHESAVTLCIDGLDSFYLDDGRDPKSGKPRFGHYIISAGQSGGIIGWFRNLGAKDPKRPADAKGTHDSFQVADYGKGLSSKVLGNSAVTGQVTVTFAASWSSEADKPRDETGKGLTETTQGPPRTQESDAVKRNIGSVRDIITIRYDKK